MKKNYGIVIAVCLVILYVAIRSFTVDVTHDEAYSFYNVKHFWYVEALCTANTHWLNSVAIKIALLFGSESNWAIRWFSTFSAIVFFTVCYFFIRSLNNIYHKLFACTLLLFNLYVLDYFGLARGYASGLMFEGMALLLFIQSLRQQHRRLAFLALLSAGLSAIGNYSFVYFFIAFSVVYFFCFHFKKGFSCFRSLAFYIDATLCLGVLGFIVRAWIFIIRCSMDLGAGTDSIKEVCMSFINGLVYFKFIYSGTASTIITCLLLGLIIITCFYGIFKFKKHKIDIYFFCSLMLSIILFILAVNFFCLKIVLPYERSALFMFPLVCICIIYFVSEAFHFPGRNIVLIVYSVTSLFIFSRKATLTYTLDFAPQENIHKVFNYIDSIGATNIGMGWQTYGVYRNYYQMTDKFKYHFKGLPLQDADSITGFNYLLLTPPYSLTMFDIRKLNFTAIKVFPKTNSVLVKVDNK
jgi:hypothetical protein